MPLQPKKYTQPGTLSGASACDEERQNVPLYARSTSYMFLLCKIFYLFFLRVKWPDFAARGQPVRRFQK